MQQTIKSTAILPLLCFLFLGGAASALSKKRPVLVFYTAFCYEADMEGEDTMLPLLPSETTFSMLENMMETSDSHIEDIKAVYGYERYRLLATLGGSLAINLSHIDDHYKIESHSAEQSISVEIAAFWSEVSKNLNCTLKSEALFTAPGPTATACLEMTFGMQNEKTTIIGRALPSPNGRRALFIALTPHIIEIKDQNSYNDAVSTYQNVMEQIPGSHDIGGARLFQILNRYMARKKRSVRCVNISDLLPPLPPPPPQSDDGTQTYTYAYEVAPAPIGGWKAFSDKLDYPNRAQWKDMQGVVLLYAKINRRGYVTSVRIKKRTIPTLDDAAIKAVKSTRWTPAKDKSGAPITVWINIPIIFRLK